MLRNKYQDQIIELSQVIDALSRTFVETGSLAAQDAINEAKDELHYLKSAVKAEEYVKHQMMDDLVRG